MEKVRSTGEEKGADEGAESEQESRPAAGVEHRARDERRAGRHAP